MQVLDLFSGIGGASLGLHWAGMQTIAFCEQNPFAAQILKRHWPGVPIYKDIQTLSATRMQNDGIPEPDLICGGFPCQDISLAGKAAGIQAPRSGLWSHMVRLVAECRPKWVVAENVPGLRSRGADQICANLEALGYTCWPLLVAALHAGAPHRRQRMWLVAQKIPPNPGRPRLETWQPSPTQPPPSLPTERRSGWPPEPRLRRMDDGIPTQLDRQRTARLKALGNAIVPANAAMLGRAIMRLDASRQTTAWVDPAQAAT